jgi:GNAT superfamily N-acetyltransferase
MDLAIRSLEARDFDQWNALYASYLDFYETSRSEEDFARIWRQVTSSSSTMHGLVAEQAGRVVGLTHFSYQASTWARVANCYLEDLFVEIEARGHGIAQALIGEVERRGRAFGCTELFWITAHDNAVARRTYDAVAKRSAFMRYEIGLEGPS